MVNKVVKTLVFDQNIRLYLMDNTKMLQEIMELNYNENKAYTITLAKAVSGISLVSATLKAKQRISVTFTMTNHRHKIYADTDFLGNVRGYTSQAFTDDQDQERKNQSLKDIIGPKGSIRIIKGFDMNQFTGITDMPFQNIDDDLSHYFKQSDQVETVIKTIVDLDSDNLIRSSIGVYAQALPGAPGHLMDTIKKKFNSDHRYLKELMLKDESCIERELNKFFSASEVIGHSSIQFYCGCSKELFYSLLYSINKEELKTYVDSNIPLESKCHICGRKYQFSNSELRQLL